METLTSSFSFSITTRALGPPAKGPVASITRESAHMVTGPIPISTVCCLRFGSEIALTLLPVKKTTPAFSNFGRSNVPLSCGGGHKRREIFRNFSECLFESLEKRKLRGGLLELVEITWSEYALHDAPHSPASAGRMFR